MRVLIIDTYYPAMLRSLYERDSGLADQPYTDQWRALMDQCFGTADFYSSNLQKLGHEATEVVGNCVPLQRQWAREHGLKLDETKWSLCLRRGFVPWLQRVKIDWLYPILTAQVKHYRPDVLYIQDMNGTSPAFLSEISSYVGLIVGYINSPIKQGVRFTDYDLILAGLPSYVKDFRASGFTSHHLRLGFEARLLERLQTASPHRVVFVGGISELHQERFRLLEKVANMHPIECWGYGYDSLSEYSSLRASHQGAAWGISMYNILYNSAITLNNHGEIAGRYAANMRLYEATGVGSLLITDYKDNLHTLFEPGREVVAYRSAEECTELITYYLEHEDERKTIAHAGQQRTLREHTYFCRMQELVDIVTPLLHQRGKRHRDTGAGWRAT